MALKVVRHPYWDFMERGGTPYNPMPWQNLHIHSKRDYKRLVLACGRRSGKSHGIRAEVVWEAAKPPEVVMGVEHPSIIYIGGPNHDLANRVFKPIWDLFVPPDSGSYMPPLGFLHATHDKQKGYIELTNGTQIWRKTADDPKSMQGERVTFLVAEEAQDWSEDAWANVMPALADSDGRAIMIGIARGKGRFRAYYHSGLNDDPLFYSASVPTSVNPIIGKLAEQENMQVDDYIRDVLARDLTEIEMRQQYYAEWVGDDGTVFKGHEKYFTAARPTEPYPGRFIMGLDVAKITDYMVAYVIDMKTMTFVDTLRFQGIDYTIAGDMVAALYEKWKCRYVHMDVMSAGEAFKDILHSKGCAVIPFKYSNESKGRLVGRMSSATARGEITYLKDDDVLKSEMTLFEATIAEGGNLVKYGAPPGYHDDAVNAAALAIYKALPNSAGAQRPQPKPYVTFKGKHRRRKRGNRVIIHA